MAPQMLFPNKSADIKKVRVGFIGLGGRGVSILRNALQVEGVEIVAVCDILEERNTLTMIACMEKGIVEGTELPVCNGKERALRNGN